MTVLLCRKSEIKLCERWYQGMVEETEDRMKVENKAAAEKNIQTQFGDTIIPMTTSSAAVARRFRQLQSEQLFVHVAPRHNIYLRLI